MNTYKKISIYTRVYIHIFEYLYKHRYFVIHAVICVLILEYTYNYMRF